MLFLWSLRCAADHMVAIVRIGLSKYFDAETTVGPEGVKSYVKFLWSKGVQRFWKRLLIFEITPEIYRPFCA